MAPPTMCALYTLLLMLLPPAVCVPCPRLCSCPQPTELHCTFRSLLSIPPTASRHVVRMNLGFNSINKITDKSLAGLRKLELLMVHGNDIHSLPDGVFRDQTALQMLKMSYNKLREISRHTFQGLWSLARLHLDHNRLELIHPDAFQGLTALRMLQLEGNRIWQLHPATFATFTLVDHFHVSTLRHLYLSDNLMTALPSGVVAAMPQLENLYLHGNPWTCDCKMRWLLDWAKTSPGILKCKKDKALPGGQLCPMCSSPGPLQRKELQAVENMDCSSPSIHSSERASPRDPTESEGVTAADFRERLGNISLDLSDEHGNAVDLECAIREPRGLPKVTWEQIDKLHLAANITLSVDLECPVDREKYELMWRLIAYYSNVPAHLQRGIMLQKEPHPRYIYEQDSERDAQYYTGVKVSIMARPAWLMQTSADLQLNRLQSSANMMTLTLSTDWSETVEADLAQRQRRTWVMIESTNKTVNMLSATLGSPSQMSCSVLSSGHAVIHWMLPDGSKVEAPYSGPDNRVFVSDDGQLDIRAVRHKDTGLYYCIAKVHGDLAVLPYHLNVQESSSPIPGGNALFATNEEFVGRPISLPCQADGSPDAEIYWILPSSNIVSFHANSSRALVYSNGTLHIPQTQMSDSGHYKCVAMNQYGVDTVATKVTLNNHNNRGGLIRPLRKFPVRPQSASGINTQIKVPTEDAEEASGAAEVNKAAAPVERSDPSRSRIPGGAAQGRKGVHPSRKMWRRPPLLGKQPVTRVNNRNSIVEGRRKMNMSKSKIDPEKWADILGKIRDRHAQSTVTPLPVQYTTERRMTQQKDKNAHETMEGSADGMFVPEKASQQDFPKAQRPTQHTQINTNRLHTQGQGTRVTSDSHGTRRTQDWTSDSQHTQATAEPQAEQTADVDQHAHLDAHTTSDGVFSLQQPTSAPVHTVTLWPASTNIASSSSSALSLQENQRTNTDVDEVKTTVAERSDMDMDRFNAVARSSNDGELSPGGTQMIPSVIPAESQTGQEDHVKYLNEPSTLQTHTQQESTTRDNLRSQAIHTATTAPTSRRRGGSGRQSTNLQQRDSRTRSGLRRRRPNRRNQKLNKPTRFIATDFTNAPVATVGSAAFTQLKIEASEVTTANSNTTVPLSRSQATSSDTLSHSESTISGQNDEEATGPSSLPAISPQNHHNLLPQTHPPFSTAVAPSFATALQGVGRSEVLPQTVSRISHGSPLPENMDRLAPTTQQRIMNSYLPTVPHLAETQKASSAGDVGPVPQSDNTVTQVHTRFGSPQPSQHYTATEKGIRTISKEFDNHVSLPLPKSTSAIPSFEHEIGTTPRYISSGIMTTQGIPIGDDLEEVQTPRPTVPVGSYYSSSPNENTSSESGVDAHLVETANIGRNDADVASVTTAHPTAASSRPEAVDPFRVTTSSPGSTVEPSPRATSQEAPRINIPEGRSHEQETRVLTTSEPQGSLTFHQATQSIDILEDIVINRNLTFPDLNLNSRQMTERTVTVTPTITAIQTTPSTEGTLSAQVVTRKPQLPGRGFIPRGKPRITKGNLQIFPVKAETDAQLLCEAEGEPKPFLSWTKVASGLSIAQNTRVQRFEVHPNGTLIIRNTQPMDGGQYLCSVQNQYGTDESMVNLLVLSQPPRVLQPRHREVAAHVDGLVLLECKVEGTPAPRVTWLLPNHVQMPAAPLGPGPQKRVAVLSDGTLRITQAALSDRGVYKCVGSSAAGADAVSVHLHVSAFPPAVKVQQSQQENRTLSEGSTAYMHCTAPGSTRPVIHWITPEGLQLTAPQSVTGHNLMVFPNGTLRIQRLGPGNAGRYECTVRHSAAASTRRTVFLSVRSNPSAAKASITSSSPQRTDVMYGGTLLLNCVAKGQPEPRITWRTPSKKLVDVQYSFEPRIKVFHNGTLTVHSVTEKDSGDYLCVARNKLGDDYVSLAAHVLTRPAKIKQKQQQQQWSQEVAYGGDLKVDCVASGLPNPEISWALPDGTMVNPVKQRASVGRGRGRRYVVFDNGTLYFKDVGAPEEGVYTCYAENQLGKDEMKVRVKIATFPPQIQDKDQKSLGVFYGETVTLRCDAKGEPMPVITWISPTNRFIFQTTDKYDVLDDGTLVVHKVQRFDGGNYTCMAKNNAGQDHKVTRLEVLVTSPLINGLSGSVNTVRVSAVQDQRKLVDCLAKGTPTPRIMWVLPGNVILPAPYNSKRISVHQNGTLEIRSPKRTDSGQLTCIARNEGGEVRLVVNLDVKGVFEMPQTRGPKADSLLLTVGIPMNLHCTFEGPTPPYVTWILPNGASLHSGARLSKFFHQPNGSLFISNPSVAEAGMYRCLGRTSQGLVEQTTTLVPGKKPVIINRYNSAVSVMNGERLLLHCMTSGEPLRLSWTLPSGVVLNRPQRAGRYAVLANGTLDIQQVSVYDRGSYVCRTANEYGSSVLSVSVIVIAYPPQITNGPPSVTYAKHGVAIQLNCVATGIPRVEVAWETPDKTRLIVSAQPRLYGNKYLHPQGSLIIQNPTQRDAGVYRCTARNAIGVDTKATLLNVF